MKVVTSETKIVATIGDDKHTQVYTRYGYSDGSFDWTFVYNSGNQIMFLRQTGQLDRRRELEEAYQANTINENKL